MIATRLELLPWHCDKSVAALRRWRLLMSLCHCDRGAAASGANDLKLKFMVMALYTRICRLLIKCWRIHSNKC